MILYTDIGHDPDDAIALAFLCEHRVSFESVGIFPGYQKQASIVMQITGELWGVGEPYVFRNSEPSKEKEDAYNPGKHSTIGEEYFRHLVFPIEDSIVTDKALIIGPAKGLGKRLECDEMYFQGGYSPNSIEPLEKFRGITEVQSYNPSGAREDFKELLASDKIKRKYYIGKNVCHGFTKATLEKIWKPRESTRIMHFWNNLEPSKAMHDVLAAILFMNKDFGIWERAKPVFNGLKMTTVPTDEEIYSLIGINKDLLKV